MFDRVAYTPTMGEYDVALLELRYYKVELGKYVKGNEPEQWTTSKFSKEIWGRMNNNVIESWNNWMRRLRNMLAIGLSMAASISLGRRWISTDRTY